MTLKKNSHLARARCGGRMLRLSLLPVFNTRWGHSSLPDTFYLLPPARCTERDSSEVHCNFLSLSHLYLLGLVAVMSAPCPTHVHVCNLTPRSVSFKWAVRGGLHPTLTRPTIKRTAHTTWHQTRLTRQIAQNDLYVFHALIFVKYMSNPYV